MKNIKKIFFKNIFFLTGVTLLEGCVTEGRDAATPTLYNIVELVQMDQGVTTFALYAPESDTPALLSAQGEIIDTTHIHIGNALYLAYSTHGQGPFETGAITPRSYSSINNINLQKADFADITAWDVDPVKVESLWRAGTQVFMRLRLPYDEEPRHFALIVDATTLDNPIPDAYLYHASAEQAPTFPRRYYAAVQLAPLWSTPDVTGLRIHIATPDGPRVFTLTSPK